jgi:inhibitor of the pro-sigma K processing machinery
LFIGGNKMQSTKVFLGIMFAVYVLFIFISMIKSKKYFTVLFLTILQGICALFTVNLLGQYISIHIPINEWTIGVSSIGGISGVIMMLLCDGFMM